MAEFNSELKVPTYFFPVEEWNKIEDIKFEPLLSGPSFSPYMYAPCGRSVTQPLNDGEIENMIQTCNIILKEKESKEMPPKNTEELRNGTFQIVTDRGEKIVGEISSLDAYGEFNTLPTIEMRGHITKALVDPKLGVIPRAALFRYKKIIFSDPATIILWADGTKTVVKCSPDRVFDPYTGVAICFMKKALGNKNGHRNKKMMRDIEDAIDASNKRILPIKWADSTADKVARAFKNIFSGGDEASDNS